jgi:hypothetical protein
MLHIELNLSANAVAHIPQAQAQLLFEYPPQACTRLQQGTLAPYCALVSLTAAASMLPPAGERQWACAKSCPGSPARGPQRPRPPGRQRPGNRRQPVAGAAEPGAQPVATAVDRGCRCRA